MKLRKMWLEQYSKTDIIDINGTGLEYSIWEIPEKLLRKDAEPTYGVTGTKYIEPVYVFTPEELKELLQKHFAEGHYMGQLYDVNKDAVSRFSLEESFERYWQQLMKEQE